MKKNKNYDSLRDQLARQVWRHKEAYGLYQRRELINIFNYGPGNVEDRMRRLYKALEGEPKYEMA